MKKTLLTLAFGVLGYFTAFTQSLNCDPLTPCLEEFPVQFVTSTGEDELACPFEICIEQSLDCSERSPECPPYVGVSYAPICSTVEQRQWPSSNFSKVKMWTDCGANTTGCKVVTSSITIQRYSEALGTNVAITFRGRDAENLTKILQGQSAPYIHNRFKFIDCNGNIRTIWVTIYYSGFGYAQIHLSNN